MVILFIDLVRASIGPFLSSHVFFRSQKNVHPLIFLQRQRKITQNRQARAKETSRASKPIIPPEKRNVSTSGSNFYFLCWLALLCLQVCNSSAEERFLMRQTMLKFGYQVASQQGVLRGKKKWFPLNPNSGRRVKNRRQWFVPCPSSSDTAVWVLQDSCQSMVIRALSAQGVLLALCAFLYTNTYTEQNS